MEPHEMDTSGRFQEDTMVMIYFWGINLTHANEYQHTGFENNALVELKSSAQSCGTGLNNRSPQELFEYVRFLVAVWSGILQFKHWMEPHRKEKEQMLPELLEDLGRFLALTIMCASVMTMVKFTVVPGKVWFWVWLICVQ